MGKLARKAQAASDKQAEAKRRRAQALLALVQRRKQRITDDFYDIGEALRELLRKELYKALGFASVDELVQTHEVMSGEQARKLIMLVEHMPRVEDLRLGQDKAYALVAYTLATPEADVPAERVRTDAKLGDKPVSKSSVRDRKVAAAEVRKKVAEEAAERGAASTLASGKGAGRHGASCAEARRGEPGRGRGQERQGDHHLGGEHAGADRG